MVIYDGCTSYNLPHIKSINHQGNYKQLKTTSIYTLAFQKHFVLKFFLINY